MLVEFSNQLYNKSIDIKKIKEDELGQAPGLLPFFNEIIMEVIIAAEIEYEAKIQESNKIDLRETMIILNDVVSQKDKEKTHLDYKYIFIERRYNMIRVSDIMEKEIINVKNGKRMGFITDIDMDINGGKVISFSISGDSGRAFFF